MRRYFVSRIIPEVKTSEIINNEQLKIEDTPIIIYDDINCNNIETISKVVKFIKNNNVNKIDLRNCNKNLYLYFTNYAKRNNISINVQFDKEKYSVKEMYSMLDASTKLNIDEEDIYDNIFDINKDDLDKVYMFEPRIFKGKKLSLKEMVIALDYIAKQVAYYAENDIQKVLLVDKMLRENTNYDKTYYNNKEYFDNIITDEENYIHKSHILETIFVDRIVVCNVFSLFTMILFKHPLLNNVTVKEILGDCCGEGHAWNEIKIHNRWYTQDFTHNVWFDKKQGVKYTLKHKTNPTLQKDDGSGFDYLCTMPEEVVRREYEKINDIHIKFPTMEQIKTGNFELPEIVNNEVSTRRNILLNEKETSTRRNILLNENKTSTRRNILLNENETSTRRKIDFSDNNNESTRRNIKIITRRRNVLKDN